MKAKSIIGLLSVLLTLCSCGDHFLTKSKWRDISINKTLETKTNKAVIRTTVDKYSKSRKWFYGSIKICNQSLDTLNFNFNQSLLVDNTILKANYNLYPVSWAFHMFFVLPNSCRTWNVAWKNENLIMNFENIVVQVDTHIVAGHYPKTIKTD